MTNRKRTPSIQPYAWIAAGVMLVASLVFCILIAYQGLIFREASNQPEILNSVFFALTCTFPAYELWRTKTIKVMGLSFRAAIFVIVDWFLLNTFELSMSLVIAFIGIKSIFIFFGPSLLGDKRKK